MQCAFFPHLSAPLGFHKPPALSMLVGADDILQATGAWSRKLPGRQGLRGALALLCAGKGLLALDFAEQEQL